LEAEFFTFPDFGDFFVMYPRNKFVAPPNSRLYTPVERATPGEAFQIRGRICDKCGRHLETTFWPAWFVPPAGTRLGAAQVERAGAYGNESFSWICDRAVYETLRMQHGWRFRDLEEERSMLARRGKR
jgi:hypothetical protein